MAKMGGMPIKLPKVQGGSSSAIRKRPRPVQTNIGKPAKGKMAF